MRPVCSLTLTSPRAHQNKMKSYYYLNRMIQVYISSKWKSIPPTKHWYPSLLCRCVGIPHSSDRFWVSNGRKSKLLTRLIRNLPKLNVILERKLSLNKDYRLWKNANICLVPLSIHRPKKALFSKWSWCIFCLTHHWSIDNMSQSIDLFSEA